MRIAAAAYPLDRFERWDQYEAKLTAWVAEAAGDGADLLVFPEYGAMELASLSGASAPAAAARAVADLIPRADRLHRDLATAHGVHILAASAPVPDGERFVNRARFFAPSGGIGHQDKQIMTRYEREVWDIRPGGPLRLFETALGRIGVLICYDCEFPLLARALVEAGARILLVPSNTDAPAGHARVRIGAMARALENQCIVVQSPVVGAARWCEPVDENTGAAAVYGPPDSGFSATGILAEGCVDQAGWIHADVDPAAVEAVRSAGQVINHLDWPRQHAASKKVETWSLRA